MSTHEKSLTRSVPALAGGLVYYFLLRPQMLKWGTHLGESQRRLPGDQYVPKPSVQMTHAINIDAPPQAVWPWLAQMGRERTGFYALDMWTNQGIPSVTFVRQDIPEPTVDMEIDGGYQIMELEAEREFLFGGFNLQRGITQDVTSLYLLERRRDGSTRLLTRRRVFIYGLALYSLVYEGYYFIFSIQQLNSLKQHAESMAHLQTTRT